MPPVETSSGPDPVEGVEESRAETPAGGSANGRPAGGGSRPRSGSTGSRSAPGSAGPANRGKRKRR
jgi:YidC/Oxa1 family membrane protein insertase